MEFQKIGNILPITNYQYNYVNDIDKLDADNYIAKITDTVITNKNNFKRLIIKFKIAIDGKIYNLREFYPVTGEYIFITKIIFNKLLVNDFDYAEEDVIKNSKRLVGLCCEISIHKKGKYKNVRIDRLFTRDIKSETKAEPKVELEVESKNINPRDIADTYF